MVSSLTKAVHCIFSCLGLPSRGWFRSIDLWVMGPARYRCATLLFPHPRWDSEPTIPGLGGHCLIHEATRASLLLAISLNSTSVKYYSELENWFQFYKRPHE